METTTWQNRRLAKLSSGAGLLMSLFAGLPAPAWSDDSPPLATTTIDLPPCASGSPASSLTCAPPGSSLHSFASASAANTSVEVQISANLSASADATLVYWFEVHRPATGKKAEPPVPLLVSTSGFASPVGGTATASLTIGGDLVACSSTVAGACAGYWIALGQSTSYDVVLTGPNSFEVVLSASAATGTGGGSGHAFASALIQIDPSFLNEQDSPQDYSLKFSSNAALQSVPEPAALASLLSGLIVMGGVAARRRFWVTAPTLNYGHTRNAETI